MKKYGQYENHQTTILDACILNAFKNEYHEQCNILNEMHSNSILNSVTKDEKIFNNFNLAKGNQLFKLKGSNLFNQSTLLFHDMYQIDKNCMYIKSSQNKIELFTKGHTFNNNNQDNNNESFFDVVELDETMSYFNAVKFAYEMQKSSNGLLYGIVLKRNDIFINPLHPIIAQSLTKKHKDKANNSEYNALLNNQYNVFIYAYNKDVINECPFELFNNDLRDTFKNHIFNVLAMLEQTFESSTKISSINDIRNDRTAYNVSEYAPYQYRELSYIYEETFEDKENEYNVNIEPVQVVNDKLIYPYYGIVAQKYSMTTSMKGYQLSPMLSPNVGSFRGSISMLDNNEKCSILGGSICTGRLSSSSENGWRSLNHANLGSPYFRDILSIGAFTFAKLSLDISLNIYARFLDLELLDIDLKQKSIPISFETFKKKGFGILFKEYIKYCKQQEDGL